MQNHLMQQQQQQQQMFKVPAGLILLYQNFKTSFNLV
jgi:hypothetical protein